MNRLIWENRQELINAFLFKIKGILSIEWEFLLKTIPRQFHNYVLPSSGVSVAKLWKERWCSFLLGWWKGDSLLRMSTNLDALCTCKQALHCTAGGNLLHPHEIDTCKYGFRHMIFSNLRLSIFTILVSYGLSKN